MNLRLFLLCLLPLLLQGQTTPPPLPAAPPSAATRMISPRYNNTSLDVVLDEVALRTGKVILRDPKVANVTVTLTTREPISVEEFLQAVESLLAMNNIALVPFRENFLKVVPADGVVRSGAPVLLDPAAGAPEEDGVSSQLIELKHLDYTEVQALITERLSPTAKVQPLERANGLLVTDSRTNIRRILEILALLDRPAEVREEVRIYELAHARASEIKARLEELIQQSQEELNRRQNRNGSSSSPIRTPPGVIRPVPAPPVATPSEEGVAAPGLIRGRVQMVADDRTNILLLISRPENDKFFGDMISTLDRKVDPEITVRIHSLQFADAENVAATLNELIGAASSARESGAAAGPAGAEGASTRTGQTLRDFIQQRAEMRAAVSAPAPGAGAGDIGRIAENTKILADKRTNALVLMGRNADLDILEGVVGQLDKMLAQVLVRAVIMEVNLNNNLAYGIDWLQRSLVVNNRRDINGVPIREPVMAFGGGQNLSSTSTDFLDGAAVDRDVALSPGALSYFTSFYDFNLDAVLRLAQGSSDAKVIATPIIMTTDNTEASIVVGERRAIPTTTSTTIGGSVQSAFEYEDIGLDLSVTPRINPQGMVIMEVSQSSDNVGGTTRIDGNDVPIITTRQLTASVAIRSGGTLVLGGLVREDDRESVTKVPLLGSIPFLGALFRSTNTEKVRTELLVLISPQVVVSPEDAEELTRQLKRATELGNATWYRGWDAEKEPAEGEKPD